MFVFVCVLANKGTDQHLHDPGQPPEWQKHAHAADQSRHACGREIRRKVHTMHHGGFHDLPHNQVTA